MINVNKKSGFIALFSVIIISAILILISVTLSFSGFFERFNILDSESKERSNALADACIDSARLQIALNDDFIGSNDVTIGNYSPAQTCHYIVSNGGVIVTNASYNSAYTFFWLQINTADSNLPITDFKECQSLSPCP